MINLAFTPQEEQVLSAIEELEIGNYNVGEFGFIKIEDVAKLTGLSLEELNRVLDSLRSRRLVIWDKQAGVKSRIGHIIGCLYLSRAISRTRQLRNVADLKYIKYVKQIPQYIIDLNIESTRKQLDDLLDFSEPEQKSNRVVTSAIAAISTFFPKISQFQLKSTIEIIRALQGKSPTKSIVIVADTGAGKSLAYQLPLLLWILTKKMRSYIHGRKKTNCSAILVFPRNVLAQDQFEELTSITTIIEEGISKLTLPSDFIDLLRFRVVRDFGGVSREEKQQMYESRPDIIITNTESLKRRLLDPIAHTIYKNGVDMVLYDEIHLYSGLHGAYVAGLNARLVLALPKKPVFIGMSATIAKPEKHCQRLFALRARPILITDRDDVLIRKAIEHHVILKPRAGRPSLGVAIDAVSALLHNRRDGVIRARQMDARERPKSICFSDSLDTTGRWRRDQNNLEFFELQPLPKSKFYRGYPIFYMPGLVKFEKACMDCFRGRDVVASFCDFYKEGRCWYFSQDSGDANTWINPVGTSYIPDDNIRSKRLTSQEVSFEQSRNVYDLFTEIIQDPYGNRSDPVPIDNLIATSVLEVGVDFQRIKEIIMYGEIQSPTNYKQKAGRGAREGNMTDGLFVLSIIPPMPLANFYYRHFYRLVTPTMSPIPLEPGNPDAVKSHAFACIFDFFAKQNVDIYNVIELKKGNEEMVQRRFEKALSILEKRRPEVEEYVRRFLGNLGISSRAFVKDAVENCQKVMKLLCREMEIDGEKKKLIVWAFNASRFSGIFANLETTFRTQYHANSEKVLRMGEIERELEEKYQSLRASLKSLGVDYQKIADTLDGIMRKAAGAMNER